MVALKEKWTAPYLVDEMVLSWVEMMAALMVAVMGPCLVDEMVVSWDGLSDSSLAEQKAEA